MTRAPDGPLRLALLGDSIAWGQGAARPEDRLAERLRRGLAESGVPAETVVHAVPGARSEHLGEQVARALGDPPDVAVVVVGANDLTHRTPATAAAASLASALRSLRAGGVQVVLAPAPDLSAVPHVPPALRAAVRIASEQLRARQVDVARSLGVHVADDDGATSRSFSADPALFSADRFHPSGAGYAVIAAAVLPHVLTAAGARRRAA